MKANGFAFKNLPGTYTQGTCPYPSALHTGQKVEAQGLFCLFSPDSAWLPPKKVGSSKGEAAMKTWQK